jgi:alkylation response protein AidB-like acyl-CoA dehydrogenase
MDLFTASTPALEGMDGALAVVVVPVDTPGLERRPFWKSPILAGAESDEVVLRDVVAAEEDFFPLGGAGRWNPVQDRGFLWFELLIKTSYIGIASGLAERVLTSRGGTAAGRVAMATELEGAMATLEGIARAMGAGERGKLARMILVRYAAQAALDRTTALAFELRGGMAFIESPESHICSLPRGLSSFIRHLGSRRASGSTPISAVAPGAGLSGLLPYASNALSGLICAPEMVHAWRSLLL